MYWSHIIHLYTVFINSFQVDVHTILKRLPRRHNKEQHIQEDMFLKLFTIKDICQFGIWFKMQNEQCSPNCKYNVVLLSLAQSEKRTGNKKFHIFPVGSSKPDNTGGIAASIIVVLLLIGTLIALLVYYLKTRGGSADPSSPPPSGGFTNDMYESEVGKC